MSYKAPIAIGISPQLKGSHWLVLSRNTTSPATYGATLNEVVHLVGEGSEEEAVREAVNSNDHPQGLFVAFRLDSAKFHTVKWDMVINSAEVDHR